MLKHVGKIILVAVIIYCMAYGYIILTHDIVPKGASKAAVVVQQEPQIIKGNVTLRTFQGYYPIVIYGTEYYFDGNIIHINDEKLGYMQIVYDDDCILIPGWIKDENELSKFGVIKLDADYGLTPQ